MLAICIWQREAVSAFLSEKMNILNLLRIGKNVCRAVKIYSKEFSYMLIKMKKVKKEKISC
jgi:hypothetical protein